MAELEPFHRDEDCVSGVSEWVLEKLAIALSCKEDDRRTAGCLRKQVCEYLTRPFASCSNTHLVECQFVRFDDLLRVNEPMQGRQDVPVSARPVD